MEYTIITGLCLWAIALELKLRERDKAVAALCTCITGVAKGTHRLALNKRGIPEFTVINRGVK